MPRRYRKGTAGLIFHVINRGAKRSQLFDNGADYSAFENLLFETREAVNIPLLAYCLMPNHWHLVLWPEADDDLSKFMHQLTCTHAQRWNAYRGISGEGAVYQGRFKAIPVQHDHHFLRLTRYVERNPLRAGLVPHVSEWRWSSLWRRLNSCDRGLLGAWPAQCPSNWVDLLQDLKGDEQESAQIRAATRRGIPFGDESWCAGTAQRLGIKMPFRERGRPKLEEAKNPPDPFFSQST